MSTDDFIPGTALASLELHRAMISLMVLHKTVPKAVVIELVDHALQRIEMMQMSDNDALIGPAKGARLHIEALLTQLRMLPDL